jgi:hypothetical protein
VASLKCKSVWFGSDNRLSSFTERKITGRMAWWTFGQSSVSSSQLLGKTE